ncbi:hypothetical protein BH09BAC3_BH09BAC3_18740 [soil metagenome]
MSTGSAWSRVFFLINLLFLLILPGAQAQILQTERIEVPISENEFGITEKFKAIGLEGNGLIVYRRIPGLASSEDQLEMIKLDTALKADWKGYISVPKNLKVAHVQYSNNLFCILFKDQYLLGGDFQIVVVRVSNGKSTAYTIKNLIPFNSTEFVITPQAALIGGYFNYRPLVLYFSFTTQTSKILPGFFNELGELNQLKTYPDGSLDVIVCAKNPEKRKSLWIKNYDSQGELIKTTILEPPQGKQLLFGRSVKLANGDQIVAGVYGRFGEYSRGIFLAGVSEAGEYAIRYYNFGDLHNFFSYMKLRKQKRIKNKVERRNEHGRKVKFNYRFLIHDLIPYEGQYIMTGEAFYPHYTYPNNSFYRTRSFYPSTSFTNMAGSSRGDLIFDGYQYTHAVVVGFDKNGKIQWDNSFEINDVKTPQLEQFVEVKPEKDRIVMMYLFENKLRSKIIRNSEVLEGKTMDVKRDKKELKPDGDIAQNEELDFWYGDYFFSYGIQKIKEKNSPTRRIFYVNKITYK